MYVLSYRICTLPTIATSREVTLALGITCMVSEVIAQYSTNLKSISQVSSSGSTQCLEPSMLDHNSPIVRCMELLLVSKDSTSKELSNEFEER